MSSDRQDHRQVGADGQDAWTGEQQDPADDHQHRPDRPQPGPGQRGRIRRGEVLGVGVTFGLLPGPRSRRRPPPRRRAPAGATRGVGPARTRCPGSGRRSGAPARRRQVRRPVRAAGVGGVGRRAGSDLDGRRGPRRVPPDAVGDHPRDDVGEGGVHVDVAGIAAPRPVPGVARLDRAGSTGGLGRTPGLHPVGSVVVSRGHRHGRLAVTFSMNSTDESKISSAS